MERNPSFILLTILVISSFIITNTLEISNNYIDDPLSWNTIKNPNDPKVVEMGKFAIDQHNKVTDSQLRFQLVLNGQIQLLQQTIYWLYIAAIDGLQVNMYEAIVDDMPEYNVKILESFSQVV
ncbi:hypothetical protein LIER_22180 [Lithospermum erythrorhizon]|uniref:Cystatin domain-containing protein n=1 Tax=Lithospermum erythrorhizon TaxID=34254 RepID=A0AAV3QW43_LITER